jgi:hypothetical protein
VTTFNVAVTVGLGETLVALKVITQLCEPRVALAALMEALRFNGVAPPAGDRLNQAQSDPSEVLKLRPLLGLVLATEIVLEAGTLPPMA